MGKNYLTAHHPIPRSRLKDIRYFADPDMGNDNLLLKKRTLHAAWHQLFHDHTPEEVVAFLGEHTVEELLTRGRRERVVEGRRKAFRALFGDTDDTQEVIRNIRENWWSNAPDEIKDKLLWLPLA